MAHRAAVDACTVSAGNVLREVVPRQKKLAAHRTHVVLARLTTLVHQVLMDLASRPLLQNGYRITLILRKKLQNIAK